MPISSKITRKSVKVTLSLMLNQFIIIFNVLKISELQ